MSSTPINNTQYLYVKRNGYANYSGATAQNSSVFGTSPIKQTTNEDSFVAFESNRKANNSNSETAQLRQSLNETKSKQGFIGKLWDGFKNLTGIGAGSSKAEKAITDYENGKISKEEMEKAVNGYTEGQKMVVDVVADMASGILAIGAFALAVPTGGASLAVGLGLATAVGAGSKVLIKGGDALLTGKEYSGKDLLYDTVTGGINGVLAPVTNGIGNTVTKTIGTKLGLTIVKEGAEEVVEQGVKQGVKQGLKSIVLNQTTDVVGGTIAKRAVALGAGMAVDGALGGAADNMVRAGLNGENVLEAGVQGAVGGLIMAPVIGGGFRVAGKAGKALGNKINTGKTLSSEVATSKIMPDTTPAIIQGGVAPDEKKMMRISLQFFGGKAADNATDATRVINGEAAKAIDLPNSVRNGDEIGFRGKAIQVDGMVGSLMEIDTYGELDTNTVKILLQAILTGNEKTDKIAYGKIEAIVSDYIGKLDDFQFDDPSNLNLVLDFVRKTHKIIGVENIDSINYKSYLNSIMDGKEFDFAKTDKIIGLGTLLEEQISDLDTNSRVQIFENLCSKVNKGNSEENISSLIKQIERLKIKFQGKELRTAIIEIYKNGVQEDKIVSKLKSLALSSKVFGSICDEQTYSKEIFQDYYSDVISELYKRGYSIEEISNMLKYSHHEFSSRGKNANTELFADVLEQIDAIGVTTVLTDYTTGSGPFNDILTVPVEDLNDLPLNDIGTGVYYSIDGIRELDSVLHRIKTKRSMTVYRGEGFEVLNQFKLSNGETLGNAIEQAMRAKDETAIKNIIAEIIGAETVHPHFLSTAYKEGGAKNFLKHDGSGILWEINTPAGSPGLYMDPFNSVNGKESEVLFNRNSRLLIKNVEVVDGIFKIYAEMLPCVTK